MDAAIHSPYGRITARSGTVTPSFGYAGMLQDPTTSLSLTQYRAYDPNLRRWLSRDPLGSAGSGINLYGYVGDNPITYSDPHGLFGWADMGLPQWVVNGSTGFGDGAYRTVTLGFGSLQEIRDVLEIGGGINSCSRGYCLGHVVGEIDGSGAIGNSLAIKLFERGGWLNSNRYLRIGVGKGGGESAGNWVFRMTGKWVRTESGHIDLFKMWPL